MWTEASYESHIKVISITCKEATDGMMTMSHMTDNQWLTSTPYYQQPYEITA